MNMNTAFSPLLHLICRYRLKKICRLKRGRQVHQAIFLLASVAGAEVHRSRTAATLEKQRRHSKTPVCREQQVTRD